jgi:hypothetical protein
VVDESKLLDSIGSAHVQKELEERVIRVTKENSYRIENQSKIEPSLSGDEVKKYLADVLKEIKNTRIMSNDAGSNNKLDNHGIDDNAA